MTLHPIPALAAAGLAAAIVCTGTATAQSRADAEAALTRMGLLGGGRDNVSHESADWSGGRYVLNGVVVRDLDIAGEDTDIDGPDELHIERMIFDAPRIGDGGRILFDALALEGLSINDPDGEGRMRLDRLSVDGPNAAMAADLARMIAGEGDFDPDWNAYRFDALGLEGLDAEGEDGDGPFGLAIEQVSIQDFGDVELGRLAVMGVALAGIDEDGAPVNFRLDELTLTGFRSSVYAELLEALASGAGEEEVFSAYSRATLTPQLDLFDRFALRGLVAEIDGVGFALDNFLGSTVKAGPRHEWSVTLDSARLEPDASHESGAQLATALGMLGYERLDLSLASNAVYDESTGRMRTVGENFIQLADGMRMEFTQDLGGYDAYFASLPSFADRFAGDVAKATPASQADLTLDMLAPVVLHDASVRFVDLSLLDRAMEAGAASQGITSDELRAQTAAVVAMAMMSAPPDLPRPLLADLSAALTRFLSEGGSLTIRATPAEPVSIGRVAEQIEAQAFDYSTLGLSFAAHPPR